MGSIYAVLTGDVVGSTKLTGPKLDSFFAVLGQGVASWEGWGDDIVAGGPERFRGDGWQLVLRNPGYALRIALLLRAHLARERQVHTRIAIGVGSVDALHPERLAASSGDAFVCSGRSLETLRASRLMDIETGDLFEAGLKATLQSIVGLCDTLAANWTQRQAEVLQIALRPDAPNQAGLGERLGISQQAVAAHYRKSGWMSLLQACEALENLDWER